MTGFGLVEALVLIPRVEQSVDVGFTIGLGLLLRVEIGF